MDEVPCEPIRDLLSGCVPVPATFIGAYPHHVFETQFILVGHSVDELIEYRKLVEGCIAPAEDLGHHYPSLEFCLVVLHSVGYPWVNMSHLLLQCFCCSGLWGIKNGFATSAALMTLMGVVGEVALSMHQERLIGELAPETGSFG
jgi:hypothetical protein